jgi:hypothetical protein
MNLLLTNHISLDKMKYILLWAAYEFIRPRAIWLFDYLISKGQK